jgi:hypothetical protein
MTPDRLAVKRFVGSSPIASTKPTNQDQPLQVTRLLVACVDKRLTSGRVDEPLSVLSAAPQCVAWMRPGRSGWS